MGTGRETCLLGLGQPRKPVLKSPEEGSNVRLQPSVCCLHHTMPEGDLPFGFLSVLKASSALRRWGQEDQEFRAMLGSSAS